MIFSCVPWLAVLLVGAYARRWRRRRRRRWSRATWRPYSNNIDWQRHAALIYRVLVWYRTSMLWSTDTCQNKVSADQYHVTISRAQVHNTSRSRVFPKLTADQTMVFDWIACSCPGRIVWKPANASPGLKFSQIITFSSIQMFFFFAAAALFYVYKIQNRKPHRKVTKLKSKFSFFLG